MINRFEGSPDTQLSFHVFAFCSKINGDEQIPAVRASKTVEADAEESDA